MRISIIRGIFFSDKVMKYKSPVAILPFSVAIALPLSHAWQLQ